MKKNAIVIFCDIDSRRNVLTLMDCFIGSSSRCVPVVNPVITIRSMTEKSAIKPAHAIWISTLFIFRNFGLMPRSGSGYCLLTRRQYATKKYI